MLRARSRSTGSARPSRSPGRRLRRFGAETFASLKVRNFRLFFAGQGISQVGNWMTLIAQSLLVLSLTDSGIALGLLAVAQFGPILVLGPWAGLVADRSDKRRLLLIVQSLAMVQSFLLAAVAFTDSPAWTVYAVALIGGFTVAFDNPAPARLRGRDGARGRRAQRRQPQQRPHDVVAGDRTGARGAAHHHRGLRLGVPARRRLLRGGAGVAVPDAHRGAAAEPAGGAGQGPDPARGFATCVGPPTCSSRW